MSHAKLFFDDEYEPGSVRPEDFTEATKGLVNKAMNALVNGWTDKDGVWHDGFGLHFFDACIIRYAFRLYDGTLTKHSPPILIMPVKPIVGKEDEGETDSIKSITYEFNNDGNRWYISAWSSVDVYGYKIYMHYDFAFIDWQNWQDIIKSVDIFVSPPLGLSNIENMRSMPTNLDVLRSYNLIKGITAETLKDVSNTSNFYLMKSIPLGTQKSIIEPEPFPSTDSDITKMENLIFQEVMTDDNFSNHKYGAEVSYAYNNRLHLGNIKTTFFRGFNPDYFLWYNTSETNPDGNPVDGNYNGYKYVDAPGSLYTSLLCEVEINTGLKNEKVYSFLQVGSAFPVFKMFMSSFLSYPDPRARRITIYRYTDGTWYKVFTRPLEQHNLLNIAFYVNDGLKPIVEEAETPIGQLPDTSKIITLLEPNKIKVSELNNPLNFPNINVYQVGGTVQAMATNAMNVSDRNYGQYPLYIFTTQGIWNLNVGNGESVYSSQSAPTYTEAPTTKIVGETPYGVVFTSQRGLLIINGQSVNFISPQIEQTPLVLNIEMNSHCDNVVFSPEHRKFSELLKDLSGLIYNLYENELIINVNGSEYNYILNFDSQQFYQSTEKISLVVENIYPDLFAVDNTTLKDYASAESPLTHISFITRPLRYGMPDIKKFERMILRALLYNVTNPAPAKFSLFMVHYSMDGVNFKALTGYPIKEGNNKDIDTNLMSRSKFSNAMFTLAGVVSEQTEIYYLDTEFDKEYNNTKMR